MWVTHASATERQTLAGNWPLYVRNAIWQDKASGKTRRGDGWARPNMPRQSLRRGEGDAAIQ
jgi:hypothetical protein